MGAGAAWVFALAVLTGCLTPAGQAPPAHEIGRTAEPPPQLAAASGDTLAAEALDLMLRTALVSAGSREAALVRFGVDVAMPPDADVRLALRAEGDPEALHFIVFLTPSDGKFAWALTAALVPGANIWVDPPDTCADSCVLLWAHGASSAATLRLAAFRDASSLPTVIFPPAEMDIEPWRGRGAADAMLVFSGAAAGLYGERHVQGVDEEPVGVRYPAGSALEAGRTRLTARPLLHEDHFSFVALGFRPRAGAAAGELRWQNGDGPQAMHLTGLGGSPVGIPHLVIVEGGGATHDEVEIGAAALWLYFSYVSFESELPDDVTVVPARWSQAVLPIRTQRPCDAYCWQGG